jgi:hypothetical protein
MIVLDLSILNQKGTPMFNSDLTANRPAAGIVGRIFIAIDAPYGIFRDTGTSWDQISSAGGGAVTTIYTGDGTLTGTRTISSGGFQLVINPQTTFFSSLIPSTSASSFAVLGSNTLTFAAGFSSSNIGNVYSANGAINSQIFSGNATFAQGNLASAMVNVNKIDFSSAGGDTITMTQSTAPGIRAMTGVQNQIQFTGSHNGTITHAAISQNLGFFRETGSTKILTITNAYSLLLNPLDDYGVGFTFTNRWGIYQAGASDRNYFAANVLLGGLVTGVHADNGKRLQVYGDTFIKGSGNNSATSSLTIENSSSVNLFRLFNDGSIYLGNSSFGSPFIAMTDGVSSTPNPAQYNFYFKIVGANNSNSGPSGFTFDVPFAPQGSGIPSVIRTLGLFNPTLGTAGVAVIDLQYTINQGGTANGITRGLYIRPTITSATDWRAIEVSTGVSVLAPATTASATLRVPSGTAPTAPVDGDIWFDGTNLFMRIGGVTKTFTII